MDNLGYILAFPAFVLDIVFFLISYVISGAWIPTSGKKQYSSVRGDATKTHGAPRSSSTSMGPLIETNGGSKTVYEMVQASVVKYGDDRVAMQSRTFVGMKKINKTDRFPSKVFDDKAGLVKTTYGQLGTNIENFGCGLRELGMSSIPNDHDPKTFDTLTGAFKMVIFEDTCGIWSTALQGAFSQSMVVATCYATLGHDAVVLAVQETDSAALLVNWKHVAAFAKRAGEMPSLKAIIVSTNEMPKGTNIFTPEKGQNIKIVSSDEVMEMGEQNKYEVSPPKPSDVAVIMYTSGSTGKPKGVVMRHSHLVAGIAGMITNVHLRPGKERFVSYLPLAHILALQIENVMLSVGATLCYTDPREMSKSLSMFQPTIFAGVPKVYEILRAGLEKKIQQGPAAFRIIFNTLLAWKIFVLKMGGDTPVTNKFFDLIAKQIFGGTLQFAVTGGGAMGSNLHLFTSACFNCPVIQGYALTETCVGGCFQAVEDTRHGVVGPPVPCVEVMLQSEPEFKDSAGLPYMHTDTVGSKGEPVIGRGEICMRGPCISSGYFKNKEKTNEDYDSEGFFHTGDIGQFTEDGVIQIIDRKKNLVKLKGGEYVAIEAMETAYMASKFVTALCVVANGDLDGPLTIICTENGALKQWAKEADVKFDSLKDLEDKKEARQAVVKDLIAEGKAAGLTSLELRMKDCCLLTDTEWVPGYGMTASMKLDRKEIFKIHDKDLHDMYIRNGVLISS